MKRTTKRWICLILSLVLWAATAVPALADDVFGPVSIVDGSTVITFSAARQESKKIMLSRQSWNTTVGALAASVSQATPVNLIVVQRGSALSRNAVNGPLDLAFVSQSGSNYVLSADRCSVYALSFGVNQLFSYPFGGSAMCRLSLSDGREFFVVPHDLVVQEAPPDPISYTVQWGDSLDMIALNYYGVQGLGAALQAANPDHFKASGGILEAGRVLILPSRLGGYNLLNAPLAGEGEMLYTVRSGDTLAAIANRYYGNPNYYTYIYQRNTGRMNNPNVLQVGQVLILPVVAVPSQQA